MAKRKNNIDDIDIVDDFELEDIDDFDPFDVLDDSYEDKKSYGNDKPRGGNASNKRNKNKKKNPVLVWAGRVGATLHSSFWIQYGNTGARSASWNIFLSRALRR